MTLVLSQKKLKVSSSQKVLKNRATEQELLVQLLALHAVVSAMAAQMNYHLLGDKFNSEEI